MQKKRMVIHCASGIKNSGDEAILAKLIADYSREYSITVISLDADFTQMLHKEPKVLKNSSKLCRNYIKRCDVFVLGGGCLLQDNTSIFNIFRWISKLKIALRYDKKTYIYANSIGPLKYSISRFYVKKYLSRASFITLRDDMSYKLLKQLGIDRNIKVTADPVFAFSVKEKEAIEACKKYELNKDYVAVSIRHWFDTIPFIPVSICSKLKIRSKKNEILYKKYIDTLRGMILYINIELKLPVYFISFCHERDAKVALDILNSDELIRNNKVIDDKWITPSQTMTIIKESQFTVGMRLHSIIYSINHITPVLPIIYEEKVKGIVRMAELEQFAIDVNNMTIKQIKEKILYLLANKEEQKRKVEVFRLKMYNEEQKNNIYMENLIKDIN